MPTPLLYESHMHTPLCNHAVGEPEEYAQVAQRRGLKGIIVTCHNPIPGGWSKDARMRPDQFDEYLELVDRARLAWAGRVDVRLGLEADYFPGAGPHLEKQLQSANFHHVLGSIHPQVTDYRALYDTAGSLAYQRLYFDHLAQAAETKLFDTLSHPDLVKNIYPNDWQLERVLNDVRAALDRIAKTGIAMELNTSGLNKAIAEMNPSATMLRLMREREIPVVLGADAHEPGRVADRYEMALDLLEAAGYSDVHFYLERKRRAVTIAAARASLVPAALQGAA